MEEKDKVLVLFFYGRDAARKAIARIDVVFSESYIIKKLSKKIKEMSKKDKENFDNEINNLKEGVKWLQKKGLILN